MKLLFMGSFDGSTILFIIALIWAILNIILFFKVWRACDDIRRIADKYDPDGKAQRESTKKASDEASYNAMLEDN